MWCLVTTGTEAPHKVGAGVLVLCHVGQVAQCARVACGSLSFRRGFVRWCHHLMLQRRRQEELAVAETSLDIASACGPTLRRRQLRVTANTLDTSQTVQSHIPDKTVEIPGREFCAENMTTRTL